MEHLCEVRKHPKCARIISLFVKSETVYDFVLSKNDTYTQQLVTYKYIGAVVEISIPYQNQIVKNTKSVIINDIDNEFRSSQKSDTAMDIAGEVVLRAIGKDKVDKMLLSLVKKQYENEYEKRYSKWEIDFENEKTKSICEMISELAYSYYKVFMENYSSAKEMEKINIDYYVDELRTMMDKAIEKDSECKD